MITVAWRMVLVLHAAAAAAWWWLMPGGFPWGNAHFWANRVLPALVLVVAGTGLAGIWRKRDVLLQAASVAVVAAWTAAMVSAWAAFPQSVRTVLAPALGLPILLWALGLLTWRGRWPRTWPLAVVAAGAATVGALSPWTQYASDPDTRPLDEPLPTFESDQQPSARTAILRPTKNSQVFSVDGSVKVRSAGLTIDVQPLLTFDSRSPDRCWTVFAPPSCRRPSFRKLDGLLVQEHSVLLRYRDDALHVLRVWPDSDEETTRIEAFTQLPQPVYSHLNTFCELTIRGHRDLTLEFSPCPALRVEVLPADYPVGRPARMAFLDAGGMFHVVEATSGEKGPFRELASGALARIEPLRITLHDAGVTRCWIVLTDWASQAATALSPTAGWGLPVNAVEFRREGDSATDPVGVWIALAATSVGRGWDSVGHAAGTYRNSLRIEPVGKPAPGP